MKSGIRDNHKFFLNVAALFISCLKISIPYVYVLITKTLRSLVSNWLISENFGLRSKNETRPKCYILIPFLCWQKLWLLRSITSTAIGKR